MLPNSENMQLTNHYDCFTAEEICDFNSLDEVKIHLQDQYYVNKLA